MPPMFSVLFLSYKLENGQEYSEQQHNIIIPKEAAAAAAAAAMCYRVDCKTCGKYGWGGCGKHLATLYASIDKGKHCMCRSWPGVVIPSSDKESASTATSTTG